MQRRKVFRTRWAYALAVITCGLFAIGFGFGAVLEAKTRTRITDGVMVGVMLLVFLWGRRLGVRVEPDGISVVNLALRKRFRWSDIERFQLAPAGIYPFAGHLILRSGRDVPLVAITVPRFFTRSLKRHAQEPVDELNALLEASRQRSVPIE